MAAQTHYFALPFRRSGTAAEAALDHLIECASKAEAVARAEQMSTYPEYVGAIAAALRKREGAPYGPPVLKASFGVIGSDLADICKA